MKGTTYWGVTLVARQELRTRLRTGRWRWLLGIWFVVIGALSVLFRVAMELDGEDVPGVPMFGGVLLFVLLLTLLVAPALTAQSINGERERGTLATLQLTSLAPGDIALGKLLASWSVGLVLLALTLPFLCWPVVEGDITPARAIVVILVVALLIGVVCATAMACSALAVRPVTSALMAYLTVFALMVGTFLLYSLAVPVASAKYDQQRTDHVWWLLAPNPFVVLADAAPRLPEPETRAVYGIDGHVRYYDEEREPFDPLGDLSREVRDIREGPEDEGFAGERTDEDDGPVWPYGLGFNLLLAGGAVWVTARRLRTPMTELPKGVRIA